MNVILRCDSSLQIGTGHMMRCLGLASYFRYLGARCFFVVKAHPTRAVKPIIDAGFDVVEIEASLSNKEDASETLKLVHELKASCIVIDSYSLDLSYEEIFYSELRVVVIDDLANRKHKCHVLIDTNYSIDTNRYEGFVPRDSKLLLGPRYAILRQEFFKIRDANNQNYVKQRNQRLLSTSNYQVLCFFGGTDPTGETLRLLDALEVQAPDFTWSLIVTCGNKDFELLKKRKNEQRVKLFFDPTSIAELLADHTIYFGSGGTITWERMYIGLPGFVATVAENQRPAISSLSAKSLVVDLGSVEKIDYQKAILQIEDYVKTNLKALVAQNEAGMNLVTGLSETDVRFILGQSES